MQIGVFLSYYDGINLEVIVDKHMLFNDVWCYYFDYQDIDYQGNFSLRNEAYIEAFEQANILINEEL